jgi:hypothetical protein
VRANAGKLPNKRIAVVAGYGWHRGRRVLPLQLVQHGASSLRNVGYWPNG